MHHEIPLNVLNSSTDGQQRGEAEINLRRLTTPKHDRDAQQSFALNEALATDRGTNVLHAQSIV